MLPAHADVDVGVLSAREADANLHELAHTLLVNRLERVADVDLLRGVVLQEGARVVAGEAARHLREVVGSERHELALLGQVVGVERGAGDLDHGADLVVDDALGPGVLCELLHERLERHVLLQVPDEGDLDVGVRRLARPLQLHGGLEDGADLHGVDFGVDDAEAAPTEPKHRVELLEGLYLGLNLRHVAAEGGSELLALGLGVRQELMEGWIEEPDDDRKPVHSAENALEVAALVGEQLGEGPLAAGLVEGEDHLAHGLDARLLEEHVLRAREADALCAEGAGDPCVLWSVGVRQHAELAEGVGVREEGADAALHIRLHDWELLQVHLTGCAVERDPVSVPDGLSVDDRALGCAVLDLEVRAAGHAALVHAPRHHSGVGSHTPASG
mmetsp:Transcript_22334/g.31225  ORF Transcript_22334/g.31225 Transcript_22334/m.31225 type:complete len:387 (+) Transcript_22334:480-1640(+)